MKSIVRLVIVCIVTLSACKPDRETQKQFRVTSPDSHVSIHFYLTADGAPGYTTFFKEKAVIDSSRLGYKLQNVPSLDRGFEVINTIMTTVDTTWEQRWGEQRIIQDNYNQLRVELQEKEGQNRKMNIVFRAYDYGVGFRYEFPGQDHLDTFRIVDELTEFNLSANHQAWWIPAYQGNRYEFLFKRTPLNDMAPYVHTPLTIETTDSLYISIHEAALVDFASMTLQRKGNNQLKCDLVPWKNGVRVYVDAPHVSPWRSIQIAEKPGDLITSYLILNLNEPNKLKDVSWVKPGKYVGIWWEMHINTGTWHQSARHAANTGNTKRYIDFAARHGFDGVLVEGWNWGWDGNWMNGGEKFRFTQAYPDYDIEVLSRYAKDKGVYIIGHHETGAAVENYDDQLEAAMKFLEDHGMRAVKTGYVGDSINNGEWHHGQYMVRHHQKVVETAAKYHVMVVAHEPIKDTGLRRTYPNAMSREAARGQEYNAWSGDGGNPPDYVTILPFTRLLSGPMDYTPGVFDIKLPTQPNNQINGTLAKELALYIVIYAPLQMACDLPENYEGHSAFQFIKDVAVDWETTKVLEAKIGEYITIARQERQTDNWYVGTITNEEPRTTTIKLDFLTPGKTYKATIYQDAPDADYIKNPTACVIETKDVSSTSVLSLKLARSGGAAVSIKEQ